MAVAFAGPGAEVTGHSFDGFAAVENGVFEFFAEVVDDRTLVKGFCEGGVEFDGVAEMFAGTGEVAFLERHCAAGEAAVGFFAAGTEPDGPHRVLGHLMYYGIGIGKCELEGLEGTLAADEGETEGGNFAGVDIGAGQQGGNLCGRVAIF